MKRNSTFVCKVMLTITILFTKFYTVNAQCIAPAMTYDNPVLISGTAGAINAQYKFPSVTPGVNAFITITDIQGGASLTNIDDTIMGYRAAWQPVVKTPVVQGAGESYISFMIEFKDSADGQNHTYNCAQLSFIDVDGDNQHVREFVAANDYDSFSVSNITNLTLTPLAGGLLQASGTIQNFAGIDTASYITNINYKYTNKYKISEVRIGNITDAIFTVQDRFACGYFKQITMPVPAGLLPVTYLSFNAVVVDNKSVDLKWVTAQEVNHSHFEVERSFEINSFHTIGLVLDGTNINGTDKSYQLIDKSTELQGRSIVYYRLKQFDIDGRVTYSKVLAVRLQAKAGVIMQVSPNPFAENLYVRFNASEKGLAQISIINATGQTVLSKQTTISKGYNNVQVDGLSKLNTGFYVARLTMNGVIIDNQKIIKN